MKSSFTDFELASLIWETMYPDRRPFKDLEQSTKTEWAALGRICRDFIIIESNANSSTIEFLKNKIKT